MSIGKNISLIRKSKKLTQANLAKEIGISRSYLSDLENDRKNPSAKTLKSLAEKLNVPLIYLLQEETSPIKESANSEVYTPFNPEIEAYAEKRIDPNKSTDENFDVTMNNPVAQGISNTIAELIADNALEDIPQFIATTSNYIQRIDNLLMDEKIPFTKNEIEEIYLLKTMISNRLENLLSTLKEQLELETKINSDIKKVIMKNNK